jgi:hypothetical protein
MRLLFIAPYSTVSAEAELAGIASGTTPEIINGLLDRSGLDRALRDDKVQYDAIHFCGHGAKSVLELSDGLLEANDFATMLDKQKRTKFVIINACDSLSTGAAVHNVLHVPVIAMDAPIEDRAAVHFARVFYSTYRRNSDVGDAFDTAIKSLLRVLPTQAIIPTIINGDMATTAGMGDCMNYVRAEIGMMNTKLDAIGDTVDQLKSQQSKTLLILLILLLVAQLITPWLTNLLAG